MVDHDYQKSLSCESSYLQFISNSKSSADFFLSNDKRFFLKTQTKREIRFLLSNLPKYLEHMERCPHSILVKFLGVHSIIAPQEKKKYFIIMQSIYYPHDRIVERYDIKGCQLDRWIDTALEGSEVIMVLKDLNFGEKVICLDQQCDWLIHQVELDTQFLKDLDVMDYSLLVGLQPLHEDERVLNKALANIIARTVSVSCKGSFCTKEPASTELKRVTPLPPLASTLPSSLEQSYTMFPESKSGVQDVLALYLSRRHSIETDQEAATQSETFMRDVLAPYLMQETSSSPASGSFTRLEEDSSYILENRRLLPSCRNPLHVIDGPDYHYFIGIIDLFTVYSFRKKLEHLWKSICYRGQNFSTVSPVCYARRLCQWVEDHTT